jgi:hypothetical protein
MMQLKAETETTAAAVHSERIAWWVQLIVVLGALLTAAGAVIALVQPAMLVLPHDEINGAARIFAGYFVARNLGLAGVLFALLAIRAKQGLGHVLALAGFIQLTDTAIDCVEGRWPIVPGVFILGMIFLFGAAKLTGHAFWKRRAWTE